jgi:arginine/lysine/ornithine decarboxylase
VKSHAQRWPQELRCSVLASRPTGTISRPTRDPLRLVIRRQTDQGALPARPLADYLGSRGIDIEFADLTRLVLIAHLDRPEADWRRLDDAFSDYYSSGADGLCTHAAARDSTCTAVGETAAGIGRLQSLAADLAQLEVVWREFLIRAPEMELKPGDMLFGKHRLELVSLNQAENRVSAAAVMPYPPGIPLLLPGERIDRARVEFLRQLSENKITISGIGQGCLWVLA